MSPTRREFLAGALAAGAVAATASACSSGSDATGTTSPGSSTTTTSPIAAVHAPPDAESSGIEHIVVVMMENRSFDHYLGWLPGADGKQAGLSYLDHDQVSHDTHHLTDWQGCDHPDPDHSYDGGRVQLNKGKCDGFLVSGQNDEFAIGYYTEDDLPFTGAVAQEFCAFDRYFAATMAETYPNRFYQHAAATDRTHNNFSICQLPTIWDRLAAKDVSAGYYFHDAPFIALWGGKYGTISKPYDQFVDDCGTGKLPAVSFVDPKFLNEGAGTSADDHPHADIRAGQWFLNGLYDAVTQGPGWDRTVMVINYDEWGGFFDHVAPTTAPDLTPDKGTNLRGFRVPAMMISPFVQRGTVGHETYDHTSILKMIEWRHDLAPLTPRDKAARNMAEVLDLRGKPNLDAPTWKVPKVLPEACAPKKDLAGAGSTHGRAWHLDEYAEWRGLRALADRYRFPSG